jgi:hypothetical protein
MAENPKLTLKKKPTEPARAADSDRFPTNEELLHELRRHGAKPPPPREIPTFSRRTRDYLLLAGIGSAVILGLAFRVLGTADVAVTLKLALTGVALWSGLVWFIFYGVMSRY